MRKINKEVNDIVARVIDCAASEFHAHQDAWPYDFTDNEVREVMSGMLARQFSIMKHLCCSPACWNWDIAPLFLRPMVELILNMAWIAKEPKGRSRAYIAYGLGQEKLRVEHMKENLSGMDEEDQAEYADVITNIEKWIAEQRFPFLVEVNVGGWAESQFKMAQESGEISLYRNCYGPYSGCVHSMWHHVARYNLKGCQNPLHRYHRIANLESLQGDFHTVYLAVKYLHRSFVILRKVFGLEVNHEPAFATLLREMSSLNKPETINSPPA